MSTYLLKYYSNIEIYDVIFLSTLENEYPIRKGEGIRI